MYNKVTQYTNVENPLFIYKDDYFQVFQQWKEQLIGGSDSALWEWDDDHQYNQVGDQVLSIPRKFSDGVAQNPPAYNEFQTFKVRNPIHMIRTRDGVDNDFNYIDVPVSNPELSYDNPDSIFMSTNYNMDAGYGHNLYNTFMEAPPTSDEEIDIEPEFGDSLVVSGFTLHEINEDDQAGCWLPIEGETSSGLDGDTLSNYQFKVFQYLHFNMDKINRYGVDEGIYGGNTYRDGRVTYIQLPSTQNIRNRLNKYIALDRINDIEYLHPATAEWIIDLYQAGAADDAYPDFFSNSTLNGENPRVQAYPLMCPSFSDDFQDRHNISNSDYHWGNRNTLAGATGSNQIYPQPTAFRWKINPTINGNTEAYFQYNHRVCFVTQPTAFMTGGSNPDNCTFDGAWVSDPTDEADDVNSVGIFQHLLFDSSLHGWQAGSPNLSEWVEVAPGFNMYQKEWLFHPDELAQYTPVRQETLTRTAGSTHAEDYQAHTTYECLWNGVEANTLQNSTTENHGDFSTDKFFGIRGQEPNAQGTGWGCWKQTGTTSDEDDTHPVKQRDVYRKGNGNRCWAIWVKEDIVGINEEDLYNSNGTELNPDFKTIEPNPNITIQKGTLLPAIHYTNTWQGDGQWRDHDLADFQSTGSTMETSSFIKIYDNDSSTGAPDNRFGFSFQLEDIEASDFIKCDTLFSGKIHCIFDEDATTDNSDAEFHLKLSTASLQGSTDEGLTGADPDYQIFGDRLIEGVPLSEIHDGDNTHIWSVLSQDQEDTNDFINHYRGSDEEWLSQSTWTEPNTYNGFTLNYYITNDNEGESSAKAYVKTDIYDVAILQILHFENVFDSDLYVAQSGRQNNPEDFIEDDEGNMLFKYTNESIAGGEYSLIEEPQDILYHFIEKEIGIDSGVDEESLSIARSSSLGNYAFSINKKIKTKNFLNDFVRSTNISPIFKSDSKFSFSTIREEYSDEDVDLIIDTNDILSYSFSRTPINDIYTIVNVKYAYDYAKDNYSKETGYVDGYDLYGNGDSGFRQSGYSYDYLRLDREDNVLEFESKYIRDDATALALRNFLYLSNCNQHNIFELSLPSKYIFLEAGDIVRFNNLIDNVKAYGEDYTVPQSRNNQLIFPYFLITYTSKKDTGIKIKCTQLHRLKRGFIPIKGSVTRNVGIDEDSLPGIHGDHEELLKFLNGANKYFTRDQRRVSDMNDSGYIDQDDLGDILDLESSSNYIGEDLNLDGTVNAHKMIELISSITTKYNIDKESLNYMKLENKNVSTDDIIEIINQLSGENDVL